MSLTIMKRIRFCAGHRLFKHEGKCAFFHGHNYVADIYVTGEKVDPIGRLVDFSMLKKAFEGWIDEFWDHGFLLHDIDENGIAAAKMVDPSKYFLMPYNPTAENMARYLLEEVSPDLLEEYSVQASKIVIWETEDSFAEASLSPCTEIKSSSDQNTEFAES